MSSQYNLKYINSKYISTILYAYIKLVLTTFDLLLHSITVYLCV